MKKSSLILISTLFPFLGFIQMNLIGAVGNFISTTGTQTQIFNLSSIFIVSEALFLIPIGIWLDKFNLKLILTIGVAMGVRLLKCS